MGNIAKRPDGRWRARYRDPSGKERAKHFDRKIDAQRWLVNAEVSKDRGEWVDPRLARVTMAEWGRRWLDAQVQLKPSTQERYALSLRRYILARWAPMPINAVSHGDIVTWVQELSVSGLAPATVRHAHRVLSMMFDLAVRDGRLHRNPALDVRLPRVVSAEKRFLSIDEVERLADACAGYDLLIRVLAYTGLRWGEAAAVRWRNVD